MPLIDAKLYWFPISGPSHAARTALELKGIGYRMVHVLPGNQRIHLRLAGFRRGTVPALKLDGRRIQGSIEIMRELDALRPEPALYPADPGARRAVEDAERWGDALQDTPRRILRLGLAKDAGLRKWLAEVEGGMPFPPPSLAARLSGPVAGYYARVVHADAEHVRAAIAGLPAALDRVDELFEQHVLTGDPPNAATLQLLSTIRTLLGFGDFADQVGERSFAPLARKLFPHFPDEPVPPFVERLGLA